MSELIEQGQLPAVVQTGQETLSPFVSVTAFETAQRVAKALTTSTIVPEHYQNNLGNCLIAMELAARTRSSIMAVMQNLYVVHGKPSWSGAYCVAALNDSGRYAEPIEYEFRGREGSDDWGCRVMATTKSGKVIYGPWVDIRMAKGEGWYDRKDKYGNFCSKWRTMPELMLRYRSASFFAKTEDPGLLMGMQTMEELQDIGEPHAVPAVRTIEDLQAPTERIDGSKIIPVGPENMTPEWPKRENRAWVDKAGMEYNPEIHASYRGPYPTVNSDGTFRMRKGCAAAYHAAYKNLETTKKAQEEAANSFPYDPDEQDRILDFVLTNIANAQTTEDWQAVEAQTAPLVGVWLEKARQAYNECIQSSNAEVVDAELDAAAAQDEEENPE